MSSKKSDSLPEGDESGSGAPESMGERLADHLADAIQEKAAGTLGDDLAEKVSEEAKAQAAGAIDSVLDQVEESLEENLGIEIEFDDLSTTKGMVAAVRETLIGIASAFVGDVKLFWAIFRTVGTWFIKPLSLDVVELMQERKENPDPDGKYRYFLDFKLIRAMFGLSLLFLVVEETSDSATNEELVAQIVLLFFYGVMLFAWIAGGWVWYKIMGIKGHNMRRFIGFLIYEYGVIYMISFLAMIVLASDETDTEALICWAVGFTHAMYFVWRMTGYYNIATRAKRIGSMLLAATGLVVFTLFAPVFVVVSIKPEQSTQEAPAESNANGDATDSLGTGQPVQPMDSTAGPE